MRLKTLFIRFYKSFNYDYLERYAEDPRQPQPWELVDGEQEKWYPYVQIPIDPKVTTIVGANESGKTHLLDAIKKGISGEGISYEDFCRYSQFFAVTQGKLRLPDVGYEWADLSDQEKQKVKKSSAIEQEFERFLVFRSNGDNLTIYIPGENQQYDSYVVKSDHVELFPTFLPKILPIKASIALPDSVPIEEILVQAGEARSRRVTTVLEQWQRERIDELLDAIAAGKFEAFDKGVDPGWRTLYDGRKVPVSQAVEFDKLPTNLKGGEAKQIETIVRLLRYQLTGDEGQNRKEQFKLAYKLICQVAKIDPKALSELAAHSFKRKEGYTGAIIERINKNLETHLNFPSWWVQDDDFRLVVSASNYDLRFAIRDRTGTTYSFSERSSGLKYFLSYYIQYKAHQPDNETSEILLMDEPDAYLSSQAQQDLLKIFEAFANGKDGRPKIQVIYVTHSPFLIDKNHPEQIRVLEKGVEDEGTRLVKDVAKNHYEPLRSAFGAFVGETAFIGNCNLMVEGLADQILIAGAAAYLNSCDDVSSLEKLDLNHLTIVSAEQASHIPYLAYLALGRDIEKPAMILLLNSHEESNQVRNNLHNKNLLSDEFILQIDKKWADDSKLNLSESRIRVEIEDLIPLPICVEAARNYAREFHSDDIVVERITEKAIQEKLKHDRTVFDAVKACFDESNLYIDKVGFARSVIDRIPYHSSQREINEFKDNFKLLFRKINKMKDKAMTKFKGERISEKLRQLNKSFRLNHPNSARRADAIQLFSNMENILDDSKGSIEVKKVIQEIRGTQKYKLNVDLNEYIDHYEDFLLALETIVYTPRNAAQQKEPNEKLREDSNLSNQSEHNSNPPSAKARQPNKAEGFAQDKNKASSK